LNPEAVSENSPATNAPRVADHRERQQAAQIGADEGQQRAVQHTGQAQRHDGHIPLPGGGGQQRQHKAQQRVNADLRPDQEHHARRDRAVLGHDGQPGVQGEQRQPHRQPGEQQDEDQRLPRPGTGVVSKAGKSKDQTPSVAAA
jgi:hypothetical protein